MPHVFQIAMFKLMLRIFIAYVRFLNLSSIIADFNLWNFKSSYWNWLVKIERAFYSSWTIYFSSWDRYHVPRSWFKPSGNVLVIFEELGADPSNIKFSRRKISGACANVAEDYPSAILDQWENDGSGRNKNIPTAHLKCPENTRISSIKFASFGNPTGKCGSYNNGNCHHPNSISVVEKVWTIIYTSY